MADEIISKMKLDNIKFVNLQFSDMMGTVKSITIPTSKFADALETGLWFDGSSIEGFARIFESDMMLRPDLSTYSQIPWMNGDGNVARVICDVYTPDGKPYESDPRYVLKKVLEEAKQMGYVFNTGPELEFFLFKRGEDGQIKTSADRQILPHDRGQYFDLVLDAGFEARREMMATALAMA